MDEQAVRDAHPGIERLLELGFELESCAHAMDIQDNVVARAADWLMEVLP